MSKLILLRHGQSQWNKKNLFTGWVDIPLSFEGIQEALDAGKTIASIPIDVIFVSSLIRSQQTAMLAMSMHSSDRVPVLLHPHEGSLDAWGIIYSEEEKKRCIPVHIAWQLNERMYGKLQGLDKQKTIEQFGAPQVLEWRRSFHGIPPGGESLAMTAERVFPYFQKNVLSLLEQGKNVFIAAHGNSLRAIVMHIERLSEEAVVSLELATGEPMIYQYKEKQWSRL